jgi:Polysaccharide deacetylase
MIPGLTRKRVASRGFLLLGVGALILSILAACGYDSDDNNSGQITWHQGTPPGGLAQAQQAQSGVAPTQPPVTQPAVETAPTNAPSATTAPAEPTLPMVTGKILSPEELDLYQPNELGGVPVFMYHNIVPEYEDGQEGDVLWRTIDEFKADLQWLYDHDFYVVTMREYITNQISAPAGKHPFVLTFDDSRPSQFYYLVNDDGSVTIDPNSAIAILEAFFAAHPDFGHTAFFDIIPIHCFDFEEPTQEPYCQQKLKWLVDHGYEVGNHTWDHQDLSDVSNETFKEKVGDTVLWLQEQTGVESASTVLILPFGVFPSGADSETQWDYIRNGFDYDGQRIKLLSVVAAGAEPAPSPANLSFDPMSIARIGAKNEPAAGEADLFLDYWFSQFEERPDLLYTSDGNPDSITIPETGPDELAGALDEEKVAAEGKEVIVY